VELDRLTDLHEAVSQGNDNPVEDDVQPSEVERPIASHRKPPWTSKEEEVLANLVDHKSWEEIGEQLGRPPGGVSQHWRKMQLAVASDFKPRLKRRDMSCRASAHK
jgi:DNA-binding NarL/FixJ family response regulator